MTRPGFTVVHKDGTRWDANHLIAYDNHGIPSLTFMCSGQMIYAETEKIDHIEFSPDGITWCNACDAPLSTIGGASSSYHPKGE